MHYEPQRYGKDMLELGGMLTLLGVDCYGRLVDGMDRKPKEVDIEPTDRGMVLRSPDGGVMVETRAYWWDDADTPEQRAEMEKPNLDIHLDNGKTFHLDWYKYMFRDTTCDMPLRQTMPRVREILEPLLKTMRAWWLHRAARTPGVEATGDGGSIIRLTLLDPGMRIAAQRILEDKCFTYEGWTKQADGTWRDDDTRDTVDAGTVLERSSACRSRWLTCGMDLESDDHSPLLDIDQEALDRLDLSATHVEWRAD